jgi:hypothetical protein
MLLEPSKTVITHLPFLENMGGRKPQKDKNLPILLTMIFGYLRARENKKALSIKSMVWPGVHNITYADSSLLT